MRGDNAMPGGYRAAVGTLRHLLRDRSAALWALLALALAMRVLVPAGFMPIFSPAGIELVLCSGAGPVQMTVPPAMAMPMPMHQATPAMPASPHGDHGTPAKTDAPCAFAGLNAPGLAGADPILLKAAIAAIMAAGLVLATTLPVRRIAHLRPPLRGPPALV